MARKAQVFVAGSCKHPGCDKVAFKALVDPSFTSFTHDLANRFRQVGIEIPNWPQY